MRQVVAVHHRVSHKAVRLKPHQRVPALWDEQRVVPVARAGPGVRMGGPHDLERGGVEVKRVGVEAVEGPLVDLTDGERD